MSVDEARAWSSRWKAVATRYRAMLAVHRDRDIPRLAALEAENAALRSCFEVRTFDDGTYALSVPHKHWERLGALLGALTTASATDATGEERG